MFQMGDSLVTVLRNVDLTLREGEFVAIEGRSGSGKSTLLHILGALDGVDGGTVEFRGEQYARPVHQAPGGLVGLMTRPLPFWIAFVLNLLAGIAFVVSPGFGEASGSVKLAAGLVGAVAGFWIVLFTAGWIIRAVRSHSLERPAAHLRNKEFGFVFQFYHLLPELTVLENTLITPMVERSWFRYRATRAETVARAQKVLTDLGLAHRLKHRPAQLSGGERQRVAIARALMNNPRVLFADEPTGNLDVETGRQIMDVIEKLHRDSGQTIVMVTHDRALAREADRVLVLKEGKLEQVE
jgi:lipoprotein-releasing system ATP-binding protein